MTGLLAAAIGIGLAVGLIFAELFGLSVGLVPAGYLALFLDRPVDVLLTLAAALVTMAAVRALSGFVIIYGRRQVVAMILVGYLVGMGMNEAAALLFDPSSPDAVLWGAGLRTVGYIVPGLIAIWFDRQGIAPTLCALVTAAVATRLILILVAGDDLAAAATPVWPAITGAAGL